MTHAPQQTSDPSEDPDDSGSSLRHTGQADNAEVVLDPDTGGEQPEQVAAAEVERHERRGGASN
jgi:hypothetical protein